MPFIKNESGSIYACMPTSMLGFVPQALGADGVWSKNAEKLIFEHQSQSVETASELFALVATLAPGSLDPPAHFAEAQQESLQRLFEFSQTEALFLYSHAELCSSLFAVQQGIKKYFTGKLGLQLLPAGEDASHPQLVLWIYTHLNAKDARDSLLHFRSEWWRKNYLLCFKDLTIALAIL